jgi:23S rRNA pseudouridine2605 synthase/16S rRNA pseudouridine516 synthase
MRDTKKEEMRNVLFREGHPVEKMKRVGLGPLTVEGVAEGRYEMLRENEVEKLRKALQGGKGSKGSK